MFSAALYARARTFCAHCARDRGCSAHPAFPAPSDFEGAKSYLQTSGASRRERLTHACFALTLNPEVRRYGGVLGPLELKAS